jgi:hypothetical protein
VLTKSPFKEQLEAQVAEKNKNKKKYSENENELPSVKEKWRAANVGRKRTAVLVVLSSLQNLETKNGSSAVLVRNGGTKNARHMNGEILFVTCVTSRLLKSLCCLFIR